LPFSANTNAGMQTANGPTTFDEYFTFDTTFHNLANVVLPPGISATNDAGVQQPGRVYTIVSSQHYPIWIGLGVGLAAIMNVTYDWFQNGALENLYLTNGHYLHFEYFDNMSTFEVPTLQTKQEQIWYAKNSGDSRAWVQYHQDMTNGLQSQFAHAPTDANGNPNPFLQTTTDTRPGIGGITRLLYPNGDVQQETVSSPNKSTVNATGYTYTADGMTATSEAVGTPPSWYVLTQNGPCPSLGGCSNVETVQRNLSVQLPNWQYGAPLQQTDGVANVVTRSWKYNDISGGHQVLELGGDGQVVAETDLLPTADFVTRSVGLSGATNYVPTPSHDLLKALYVGYATATVGTPSQSFVTPTGMNVGYQDALNNTFFNTTYDELGRPLAAARFLNGSGSAYSTSSVQYPPPATDMGTPNQVTWNNMRSTQKFTQSLTVDCSGQLQTNIVNGQPVFNRPVQLMPCNPGSGPPPMCQAPVVNGQPQMCQLSGAMKYGWCQVLCSYMPAWQCTSIGVQSESVGDSGVASGDVVSCLASTELWNKDQNDYPDAPQCTNQSDPCSNFGLFGSGQ
jgi:hypothetical protein